MSETTLKWKINGCDTSSGPARCSRVSLVLVSFFLALMVSFILGTAEILRLMSLDESFHDKIRKLYGGRSRFMQWQDQDNVGMGPIFPFLLCLSWCLLKVYSRILNQGPGRVGMGNKMLIVPLLNEEEVFGERKCEHYQVRSLTNERPAWLATDQWEARPAW